MRVIKYQTQRAKIKSIVVHSNIDFSNLISRYVNMMTVDDQLAHR